MLKVCHAFIIFKTEDGHDEAIKFSEESDSNDKKNHILGVFPKFVQAPEPANLIWENLYMTSNTFYLRLFGAVILILMLLLSSFIVMMLLDRKSIKLDTVYPSIDCDYLFSIYNET